MPKETGNKKVSVENSKKFQAMVKELVKLNNGYLTKSKTIAGKYCTFQISLKNTIKQMLYIADRDFIILPYMVDSFLNKRKNQPKFILNNNLKIPDYQENLPYENAFMTVCREGKNLISKNYDIAAFNQNAKSRFLHHQDPYLKLGPFKEDQRSHIPYTVIFRDILRLVQY